MAFDSSLRNDPFRSFRARLLTAMGLPAIVAIAGSGCGANVVFGEPEESGGSGGSGASPSTGGEGAISTDGGGGSVSEFVCEVELGPEQSEHYECIFKDNGFCPEASSDAVWAQLGDKLEWDSCDKFCCDYQSIDSIPCGPDPTVFEECCYVAITSYHSECMGRPFVVDGRPRVAAPEERADWCVEHPATTGVLEMAATAREALSHVFMESGALEHASIASFARFALDLMQIGAPAVLLQETARAMAEETRHAELCYGLASRYAGRSLGPGQLDVSAGDLGWARSRTPADILRDLVIEGCVGETTAALVAREGARVATDEVVRSALEEIAKDEERHAELAWRTVAWALAQASECGRREWRGAIVAAFEEALSPSSPELPTRPVPAGVDVETWMAHGQLPPNVVRTLVASVRADVIRPCARALTRPESSSVAATRFEHGCPKGGGPNGGRAKGV